MGDGDFKNLETGGTGDFGELHEETSHRCGRMASLPEGALNGNLRVMSDKTLFEKICDREIPAEILYEDDRCVAFRDISPQAPVHVVVVPRKPVERIGVAGVADEAVLGRLLLAAAEVARREGIDESGYRLVINNGSHGGESVPHLHVHLLGGRQMQWPPG